MRISSSLCVLMLSAAGAVPFAGCAQESAADPAAAASGQIQGQENMAA